MTLVEYFKQIIPNIDDWNGYTISYEDMHAAIWNGHCVYSEHKWQKMGDE